MKDPYTYENGVLRNKLGIKDYDKLNEAEASIGFSKLINIDSIKPKKFDVEAIKDIHRHIFSDIFDWAGEFRTTPLFKEEYVLNGLSVPYSDCANIERDLKKELDILNSIVWQNMDVDQIGITYAREIAKLWRVHPFRDGNTRTILSFSYIYAKEHSFEFDIEIFTKQLSRNIDNDGKIVGFSVRDKFVVACLDEAPQVGPLASVFREAIIKKKNIKK